VPRRTIIFTVPRRYIRPIYNSTDTVRRWADGARIQTTTDASGRLAGGTATAVHRPTSGLSGAQDKHGISMIMTADRLPGPNPATAHALSGR